MKGNICIMLNIEYSNKEGGDDMSIDFALIKEQGITFSIVVVKPKVLNLNPTELEGIKNDFRIKLSLPKGMPMILMCQDYKGRATYQGRKDIVNFLSKIHISQIPFKRYQE